MYIKHKWFYASVFMLLVLTDLVFARQVQTAHLGSPLHILENPGGINAIAFSMDGKILVSASYDWPRGTNPATSAKDCESKSTLSIWDIKNDKLLHRIPIGTKIQSFAISPDSRIIASSNQAYYPSRQQDKIQSDVRIWDLESGKLKHTIHHYPSNDSGLAFSPDGETLAVGDSINGGERGQVIFLYDIKTWKQKNVLKGFEGGHISQIAFSPDGTLIAAESVAGEVGIADLSIWDVRTTRRLRYYSGDDMKTTPFGPMFFLDNDVLVWGELSLDLKAPKGKFVSFFEDEEMTSIGLYSKGGKLMLFLNRNKPDILELWDVSQNKSEKRWQGIGKNCNPYNPKACYSMNNKLLAIGDNHGKINVWLLR
ncbi:MAG: hypothetical protein ABFD46_01215 [Armatimonadota bacterium]